MSSSRSDDSRRHRKRSHEERDSRSRRDDDRGRERSYKAARYSSKVPKFFTYLPIFMKFPNV